MIHLLIDTSVLIKWFHTEGEAELAEARALRSAHVNGDLEAHMLDLALYEVGNVLVGALRWKPSDVADQLDDLLIFLGLPLAMSAEWVRTSATMAHRHSLSFYDAIWAATAFELKVPLVSADRKLQRAGLAESPARACARLQITS
jgi:predicted nucleic acid-binding protein